MAFESSQSSTPSTVTFTNVPMIPCEKIDQDEQLWLLGYCCPPMVSRSRSCRPLDQTGKRHSK